MKKLTAGIFTVLMGLVSVNAADAAVASKGYVTQEINRVNANVTAVDTKVGTLGSLQTTSKTDVVAAINELKTDLGAVSGENGTMSALADRVQTIEDSAAYKSGINSELVTQIGANKTAIETLNGAGEGSVASKIAGAVAGLDNAADVTAGAADGSYAMSVAQADGVVTTTKMSFSDTVVANDVNAPKGGAVKTYVDNKFNSLSNTLGSDYQKLLKEGEAIDIDDATNTVSFIYADTDTVDVAVDAENKATFSLKDASVTKAKLDSAVQASLDLADSALQESDLADTGEFGAKIKANADAIVDLKAADTTINGKIGGNFDAENTVAKAIDAASNAASAAQADADAAQADADALEALVGNTAVGTQIDTKIAALALKKISQVPAQCSDPTKYCALTYGSDGFVWEVIERGDDEVLGYGNDAGRIDSNVDAAAGE